MLGYLAAMETESDRTKFETIYLAYRGLMYHVAYYILKNPQDAEDVVHQSFVKLAERMADIPDGPCPRTRNLVVTVTERKAISLRWERLARCRRRSWTNRLWYLSPLRPRAAAWLMPWHPCRPAIGRCCC